MFYVSVGPKKTYNVQRNTYNKEYEPIEGRL